jgi:hypothetical protein
MNFTLKFQGGVVGQRVVWGPKAGDVPACYVTGLAGMCLKDAKDIEAAGHVTP